MAKGKAVTRKKMSQTTREIIKTVIFFLVVGILAAVYVVYPLMKANTIMGRHDGDTSGSLDSLPVNDPALCTNVGLVCDTFRVESDGLTSLAALYAPARTDTAIPLSGTVILLHPDTADRTALLPWAKQFSDSGCHVVLYDQRASGLSTGRFHGEGAYEANDLEEVIAWLDLHERLSKPLMVIGRGVGADAAYLASLEESRIDAVAMIDPYLSTDRMWNLKKQQYDLYWFPFHRTILWWWYNIRSSYAAPYRETGDIEAAPVRTLVLVPAEAVDDQELTTLRELSEKPILEVKTPVSEAQIPGYLFDFARSLRPPAPLPADSGAVD